MGTSPSYAKFSIFVVVLQDQSVVRCLGALFLLSIHERSRHQCFNSAVISDFVTEPSGLAPVKNSTNISRTPMVVPAPAWRSLD
mmetsp:Transcript_9593/g.14080  ORF Transcript_9593/g.14080 Transcript_9593/m.14080 type:complete len:84 (+) Transcript_9593:86-337(+)